TFVQVTNTASASGRSTARTISTTCEYGTRQICSNNPSPTLATTSMPCSARNNRNRSVTLSTYGEATAIRPTPNSRTASTNAPDVVTAVGAPACNITSTSSRSPCAPRTKLPEVHAYATTSGCGVNRSRVAL